MKEKNPISKYDLSIFTRNIHIILRSKRNENKLRIKSRKWNAVDLTK